MEQWLARSLQELSVCSCALPVSVGVLSSYSMTVNVLPLNGPVVWEGLSVFPCDPDVIKM